MSQLMQVSNAESQEFSQGWGLSSVHISLVIGDTTNVLHGAEVVLWNENLIVFAERILLAKEVSIEDHTCLSDIEHLLMTHVVDECGTSVDAHWRESLLVASVAGEGTRDDSIQVG